METCPYELEDHVSFVPRYYRHLMPDNWYLDGSQVNVLDRLSEDDYQWKKISQKMGNEFDVVEIWKVQNPRSYGRYAQRALKYENWFGREPKRWQLFHGTQEENIDSIIENNFDLRNLHTKDTSFYFTGEGVYFTNSAAYADWCVGGSDTRCYMFNCEVLIDSIKNIYNPHSVRFGPPARKGCEQEVAEARSEGRDPHPSTVYDTTARADKDEYVKFRKNEFYPLHLIMYDRC
ncbi:protein mono-ADP-ribosyltransferase PARP12-like [Frankliniella occidentalis]|uniref:Poly [ADP-ribose] polymerase n=1 Tax=Frankliniella occidentalis TaxID=133901 RepID=A0A6J1S3E3_FRAOC|nr:protein mono-ADP-ribosyltransferase PARP12-like [Frankliniella occidentalis]